MKKNLLFIGAFLVSAVLFGQTEIPFDQYRNVLLSDYEQYDDNQVVKVVLSISNADNPDVSPGWGVGTIKPINNNDAAAAFSFNAQAVSAEGAENIYEFTIAQFKEYAKVEGEYYVDEYGQSGISINVYNGATLISITVNAAANAGVVFDFEADAIGTTYGTAGYSPDVVSATVEANPANAEEKSLHVLATNYRSYAKFNVALPAGKTLADVEKVTFDIYFLPAEGETSEYPQNRYKAIDCLIGAVGSTPNVASPNLSIGNLIADEQVNVWISKVIPFAALTDEVLLALSELEFAIGINHDKINYYLDNVAFVLKADDPGAVDKVDVQRNKIFGVEGGIFADAENQTVEIFSIDGKLIKTQMANGNVIPVEKGTYIVRANKSVAKVIVK
ncbi:MAG: T9SS type A sorting domain-containing protein [Prevotellaceae bacterium]|jgi:hypothetical protein|nr:T9SS type A sorting domain-containing protein [Prevotellaceae bacterium]